MSEPVKCLRCNVPLEFVGARFIQYWHNLRSLEEAFNYNEDTDLLRCPTCGHLEYFARGFGEDMRQANVQASDAPENPRGFNPSKGEYDYRGF